MNSFFWMDFIYLIIFILIVAALLTIKFWSPQNRKQIQTYVMDYDKEIIKEAITKEIEKGGQVFYIYNMVEDSKKYENQDLDEKARIQAMLKLNDKIF